METKAVHDLEGKMQEMETVDADPVLSAIAQNDWNALRSLSLKAGGFGSQRTAAWPYLLHATRVNHGAATVVEAGDLPRSHENPCENISNDELEGEDEKSSSDSSPPHPDERQIKLDTDRSFVIYPVGMTRREKLQDELNRLIVSIFRRRPKLSYFQGYHDIITVLFLTLPKELQLPCAEKLSLHRVRDAMGNGLEPLIGLLRIAKQLLRLSDPSLAALLERNTPLPYFALSNLLTLFAHDVPTLQLIQHVFDFLLSRPPIAAVYLAVTVILTRKEEAERLEEEGEEGMLHSLMSSLPELDDGDEDEETASAAGEGLTPDVKGQAAGQTGYANPLGREFEGPLPLAPDHDPLPAHEEESIATSPTLIDGSLDDSESSDEKEDPFRPPSETLSPTVESPSDTEQEGAIIIPNTPTPLPASTPQPTASPPPSRPPTRSQRSHRPRVLLSDLLSDADALYALYPPTHPSLAVASIMGPQSAVFTWSEDPNQLLDDDVAEALVTDTARIVHPYVESDHEDDGDADDEKHPSRRPRRKVRTTHPFPIETRTAVAGAVLVLSVALAVYGMRASGPHSACALLGRAKGGRGHEREWKELKRAGRWVGGVLLGAGEQVLGLARY